VISCLGEDGKVGKAPEFSAKTCDGTGVGDDVKGNNAETETETDDLCS
jgi:hypothetical protein